MFLPFLFIFPLRLFTMELLKQILNGWILAVMWWKNGWSWYAINRVEFIQQVELPKKERNWCHMECFHKPLTSFMNTRWVPARCACFLFRFLEYLFCCLVDIVCAYLWIWYSQFCKKFKVLYLYMSLFFKCAWKSCVRQFLCVGFHSECLFIIMLDILLFLYVVFLFLQFVCLLNKLFTMYVVSFFINFTTSLI